MAHQGLNDLQFQLVYGRIVSTLVPELLYLNPNSPPFYESSNLTEDQNILPIPSYTKSRDLRIGFISSHFFDHSIGRILIELIVLLNEHPGMSTSSSAASLVNPLITVYFIDNLYNQEIANSGKNDYITRLFEDRLSNHFHRFPANISLIQHKIGQDNLDFLIYADIGMDFTSYALAFSRLATFQVISHFSYFQSQL
jgi:hypothetical protein